MKTLIINNNLLKNILAKIFSKYTKNVYLGCFSPVKVAVADIPLLNSDGDVLLESILCCICGTDIAKFGCNDSLNFAASALRRKGEKYLGHEVVAKVIKAPIDSKFKKNDRVVLAEINNCKTFDISPECIFCLSGDPIQCSNKHMRKYFGKVYGGFSELFIRSVNQLLLVPNSITNESAALVEPAANALHALLKSNLKSGDRVLLYGAGLISQILIKLIRLYFKNNVEIHVLGRHKFQLDEAIDSGVDKVFKANDIEDFARNLDTFVVRTNLTSKKYQVTEYLNEGYCKVFDFVGSDSSLSNALSLIKSNGTIVAIGASSELVNFDISFLISREIKIYGIHGYAREPLFEEYQHNMISIIELMEEGKLDLSKYVTHQFGLEAYKDAINKATSHYHNVDKFYEPVFRVGIKFN
jgi:(R,R)-butanediol dehydrogenase/meso-butanediol dehydrogenase/diacetyl reductase